MGSSSMLISQKIFVAMLVWTTVSILVSISAGVEVLVTLVLIGLLIIRELTDGVLAKELRRRFDFMIYGGLVLFVVVVVHRIWLVLS